MLSPYVDEIIGDHQCGFQRNRSTTDQIVCIRQILEGKTEVKRPLGRPRCRRVENIKMDLREIGRGGMIWIHLAQGMDQWRALVNTVMNLHVS
jgi:hypothetical protein